MEGCQIIAEYLLLLYRQYCESVGKKSLFSNINKDLNNFIIWIKRNNNISDYFKTYIEYLGIELNSGLVVEANKGKYDTIMDNSIYMISPFASTFGGNDMKIYDHHGEVVIANDKSLYTPDEIVIETIITQNPYNIAFIKGFKSLHEHGKDICFGIYGDTYDSDRLNKERMMKRLFDSMDDVNLSYDTIEGKYLCALKSDRKVKKKIYVK